MNMANISTLMKNPYTPRLRRVYHMKYSLVIGESFHEAKVPVNTIIELNRSIATDIPSTPNEKHICNGSYHDTLEV